MPADGYLRDWPLSITTFPAALHSDNSPKVLLGICALGRFLTALPVSNRWLIQVRLERFDQGPTSDRQKVSAQFRGYTKGNARRFEPYTAFGSRVYTTKNMVPAVWKLECYNPCSLSAYYGNFVSRVSCPSCVPARQKSSVSGIASDL